MALYNTSWVALYNTSWVALYNTSWVALYNTSWLALYNTSWLALYKTHHSRIWARHWPAITPITRKFSGILVDQGIGLAIEEKVAKNWENFEKIAKKSISTRGEGATFTSITPSSQKVGINFEKNSEKVNFNEGKGAPSLKKSRKTRQKTLYHPSSQKLFGVIFGPLYFFSLSSLLQNSK